MKAFYLYPGLAILILIVFLGCETVPQAVIPESGEARELSSGAWQKLWENQFRAALLDFEKAQQESPEYLPGLRGLGLACYFQANEFKSFKLLLDAARLEPQNPLSLVLLQFIEEEIPFRKGLMNELYAHYKELAGNNKLPYWIRRYAWDKLVHYTINYFPDKAAQDKYTSLLENLQDWTLFGPFSNISHSAILQEPDNSAMNRITGESKRTPAGKDNRELEPFPVDRAHQANDGWVHISEYLDFPRQSSVYAAGKIRLEEAGEYLFILSRQGALNFWIDNQALIRDEVYKTGTDLHWIKIFLEKGTHNLVLQLSNQAEKLAFRVSMVNLNRSKTQVELPDFSGLPADLPGLAGKSIQDPLSYHLASGLAASTVTAEDYFWMGWLLAQQGDGEGGLELVQAARRFFAATPAQPSLAFDYIKALSLLVSNNYQDARNLLIKLTETEEIFSPAAVFVITDYINHHHYSKAGSLIEKMTTLTPDWYYALESEILLALALGNEEEIKEKLETLVKRYNKLYPDAPGLFSTFLNRKEPGGQVAGENTFYSKLRDLGYPLQANNLEMEKAFRARDYTTAARLAATVTSAQPYNGEAWEIRVFSLADDPARFSQAREICQHVLKSFPYNEDLLRWDWSVADGYVEYLEGLQKDTDPRLNRTLIASHLSDEKKRRLDAATQLLQLLPEDLSLRNLLRRYKEEKSLAEILEVPVLDKIILDFEKKNHTWTGDAVVVYSDTTELFFGKGASHSYHYRVLKILSENGVIRESTQKLLYHPLYSEMDIMQAFLVKPDGSTIDALRLGDRLSYQGLQSGDYLVYLYTVDHFEPGSLNDHYWTSYQFNSLYQVNESRFRLLLPARLPANVEIHNQDGVEITSIKEDFDATYTLYTYSAENLAQVKLESHLPSALDLFTWIDITTLTDWQPIVTWYEALSAGQSKVTYKIREKTAQLCAGLTTREEKLKAIYDFVAQKIKYEDLAFQYSAYTPQRAERVLADGFGDCKDKATLLIAMLKAADIPARIALNTPGYAGDNFFLPSNRFVHAIVCVSSVEQERVLILDPTSEYLTYPDLPAASIGSPYLVIAPGGSTLSRIPEPATRGKTLIFTELKKEGQKHLLEGSILYNNERAGEIRSLLYTNDEALKETIFNTYFIYDIPGFHLESATYQNLYTLQEDPRIVFQASLPDPVREYDHNLALLELPWLINLPYELRSALSEKERQNTFTLDYKRFADPIGQSIIYTIPASYKIIALPEDLSYNIPGIGYIRYTYALNDRQLAVSREFYLPYQEISKEQLGRVMEILSSAIRKEGEKIILQK